MAFTVAQRPALRIGESDADDGLVYATAAVRLPHGSIAIADAGARRVDVFDAAGQRVRTLGREGRGPGEFTHPSWMGLRGDTLRVWDMVQARLTLFDTAGALIRTEPPLTDLGSFPRVFGQLGDGSLLIAASADDRSRQGAFRDSLLIVRVRPASGARDTLGKVPGDERFGTRSPDGRVSESTSLPFGRRTVLAAHGDRAFVGTGDGPTIVASPDGTAWRTVASLPTAPERVSRKDIDDYWARLITRGSGSRSAPGPPAGIEYPSEYPPYAALALAPSGDVWVALPVRPSEWGSGTRWVVFAADGAVRGTVHVPGRSQVLQIGNGWILIAETDADDRQMVSRYDLAAPSR